MADDSKAPRKCKASVKDDTGKMSECGTVIPKGQSECKNRREHIHPLKTGFCASGFCEGKKARDFKGNPVKTCEFWKHCPCECHKTLDAMYAMSGMPRVAVENPEYRRPVNPFWVPSLEERAIMHASSNSVDDIGPTVVESPIPEAVPATLRRTFTPTPTGRSARGELESWVKEACDEWIVEEYKEPCTPAWIAKWVQKNKGVATQSQGAVNAVFERWIKLGFAVIEKKPTRFVRYTPDGVRLGLDALKIRAKQQVKAKTSAANRGVRG